MKKKEKEPVEVPKKRKKRVSKKKKVFRLVLKLLIGFFVVVFAICLFFYFQYKPNYNPIWGVNFSHKHAQYLGLDWKKAYLDVLDDLNVKYVRIMVYWTLSEKDRDSFDFSDYEWMLDQAHRRNVKVIAVVGRKQPRWPECHVPEWAKDMSAYEQRQELFAYMKKTVESLRSYPALEIWQVENEPIFGFGPNCSKLSVKELRQEVDFVRQLDPNAPILVTDSGEFGRWLPTASAGASYFGSTMYMTVHSPKWGYFTYPLSPLFFKLKAGMLNTFRKPQKLFGVELQAEPWFDTDVLQTDIPRAKELLSSEQMKKNIDFARKTGFERHYLWGAEWWIWMKEKHNDPSYYEVAKETFKENKK